MQMIICLIFLLSQKIELESHYKLQSNLNVIIALVVKIMEVSIYDMPLISLQIREMMMMNEPHHMELKSVHGISP